MIIFEFVLKAYAVMSIVTATDEIWNCNNPRPKPNREYLLCNWSRDDFHSFKVNGEKYNLILKQFANGDNNFKAKARKKYWDARN